MTKNFSEEQKNDERITAKQKKFVDFLEKASNQSREIEKPKLNKIWNIIIYGSFATIGIFLIYLYSAYILINK